MHQPTLIFLDIHLEPLGGYEVIEIIRAHPPTRDATVIALTASVLSEEMAKLKQSGFNGAMGKP